MSDNNSKLGSFDQNGNYPSAASPLDLEELLKTRPINAPPQASWAKWPTAGSGVSGVSEKPTVQPAQDYSGLALGQVQKGEADLDAAERAAQQEPDRSQLNSLDARIAREQLPTQLRENRVAGDVNREADTGVGTGKVLPQFKASLGRRLLNRFTASEEAIGEGKPGLLGLISPEKFGVQAAGNKAYQQKEAERQATLAGLEAQRPQMSEVLKDAIARRKEQATEFTTLGERRTQAAAEINKTPEEEARKKQLENEAAFKDRAQHLADPNTKALLNLMPPAQRGVAEAHYLFTNEMPKPTEPRQPSAEEVMLAQATVLKRQELGRNLKYDEYIQLVNDIKGKAGGVGDAPPQDVLNILTELDTKKQAELASADPVRMPDGRYKISRLVTGKDNPFTPYAGKTIDAATFQRLTDKTRVDLNAHPVVRKLGWMMAPPQSGDTAPRWEKTREAAAANPAVAPAGKAAGPVAAGNFKGPIQQGEQTAAGPGGHKIVVRGGQWVDPETGLPPSGKR